MRWRGLVQSLGYASGLRHFRPGNRWKSWSDEQSSARCSSANAAKCASEVRFPPLPMGDRSPRRMVRWRGPGSTMLTDGCSSQVSIRSNAASSGIGLRKRPGRVVRRRNASSTVHGRPMVSVPEIAASNQDFARECSGASRFTAYMRILTSKTITCGGRSCGPVLHLRWPRRSRALYPSGSFAPRRGDRFFA